MPLHFLIQYQQLSPKESIQLGLYYIHMHAIVLKKDDALEKYYGKKIVKKSLMNICVQLRMMLIQLATSQLNTLQCEYAAITDSTTTGNDNINNDHSDDKKEYLKLSTT